MQKLFVAALAIASAPFGNAYSWEDDFPVRSKEFKLWQKKFQKSYSSVDEEAKRFGVWLTTVLDVEEHNRGNHSWTKGVNNFADQTSEEFVAWANGLKNDPGAKRTGTPFKYEDAFAVPTSVDWRKKGIVNPVKNQAQCGSCWAFSTIASFEGQYALKHKLTSFSEQDLVDCVKGVNGCCSGCQGGLMDPAFEYMKSKQKGDDDTEGNYSYKAVNGVCKFKADGPGMGGISGHVDVPVGNDSALKTAVATIGVISVGVDASKGWQTYAGGVYTPFLPGILGCSSSPSALDHGVAVVGYNTDTFNGKTHNYWIVRNSWAETWGEQGYMYLTADKPNACGISNSASYPTLDSSTSLRAETQ